MSRSFFKNTMEMGIRKINEQIGKANPRCHYKISTLEKWLFEILNKMHFKHPPIIPPTLNVNPTQL
jgi:hypothetical protein